MKNTKTFKLEIIGNPDNYLNPPTYPLYCCDVFDEWVEKYNIPIEDGKTEYQIVVESSKFKELYKSLKMVNEQGDFRVLIDGVEPSFETKYYDGTTLKNHLDNGYSILKIYSQYSYHENMVLLVGDTNGAIGMFYSYNEDIDFNDPKGSWEYTNEDIEDKLEY